MKNKQVIKKLLFLIHFHDFHGCVDDEDLALTLNGNKKRIKRIDFETAFTTLHLDTKQQANLFLKMEKAKKKWLEFIEISFLSDDYKTGFIQLINERYERISG